MFKRKKIAFLLSAITLLSTVFGGWQRLDNPIVYAGTADEEKTCCFAEGFGTGVDFSEDNWKINTAFRSGTPTSITSNPVKYAAIVENEHSGNDEKIIRLINGVRGTDLDRADVDYRAGTALVKDRVPLKESSEFSAKFTISMPDACVNTVQTGGQQFAREAGGDGIAFIITPTDSINGQVGTGMGYYGVKDSLVIEMDSYFNGAYCTFETFGTAYVNWAYDNQIYANDSLLYLQAVADDTRNKGIEYDWATNGSGYWTTLNNNRYSQLSASQDRRFDHVGVMLDGVTREHIGISYLNGLQPDMVTGGKYENISNPSAGTPSESKDCATRFADAGNINTLGEEVDNRLFTFWIEYDGADLYVRYANGNFTEAVRPADPQIKLEGVPQLAHKFENDNVQIGFISSIGTSKANHTVHSVAFANKYFQNGIQTEYTEKYYVEEPDATADFITVNSKKYVLTDSVVVENADIGSKAEIRDKSTETKYQPYIKKDYSSNPLYPDSALSVKGDGTTVLYQFYDLPSYKVEYYLEKDASTAGVVQVGDKYYVKEEENLKTAAGGSSIVSNQNADKKAGVTVEGSAAADTYKSYMDYEFNPAATRTAGHSEGTVAKDNSLVIQLYYDRKTPQKTEYKEQYWVEDPEADRDFVEIEVNGKMKKFILKESNDVRGVNIGIGATVTDKSQDYKNYELIKDMIPGYPSSVDQINPDGSTIVYQIYVLKPTTPGDPGKPGNPGDNKKPSTGTGTDEQKVKANYVTAAVKNYRYGAKTIYLVKGKTAQLRASIRPSSAKQGVIYRSGSKSVASVNSKGKIRAKKAGTAKITITSADGAKKAVITVKVVKKAKVNKKLSLKSKKKLTFKKKNATSQIITKGLTAKTTSKETYKVTKGKKWIKTDPYGRITCKVKPAKKAKKAAVKVTCGKKSITIKVTIKK